MVKLISPAPWSSIEPGLPFGSTEHPYSASRRHGGKDWQWRYADPYRSRQVVAPVSGVVEHIEDGHGFGKNEGRGWGNHIRIRVNKHVVVRLAHFVKGWSKGFRKGQRINAGDYIAQMGNSGDTNGQTHLHEELLIDGVRVDPDLYRGLNGRHLPGTEAPSGGDAKPLPTPKPSPVIPEEEEEPMTLKIIVGPAGDPAAVKHFYDPETGKLVREVNGAAESAVLRAVEKARPEAVVFVEVDAKHIARLKG